MASVAMSTKPASNHIFSTSEIHKNCSACPAAGCIRWVHLADDDLRIRSNFEGITSWSLSSLSAVKPRSFSDWVFLEVF